MPSGMYNNPIEGRPTNEKPSRNTAPIHEITSFFNTNPTTTAAPASSGMTATGVGVKMVPFVDAWTHGLPTEHWSVTDTSEYGRPTTSTKTESAIVIPAIISATLLPQDSMDGSHLRLTG